MRIIILDDHTLFAQGLCKIIDDKFEDTKISYFKSLQELKESLVFKEPVDLLISDIELPGENVFPFFKKTANIPILVISMHNKFHVIKKCINSGVKGYILKDDHDKIETAINIIKEGNTYFSPKVEAKIRLFDTKPVKLTKKEEIIIKLVAEGKKNTEIANALFISIHTVKTHRKHIYDKLDINSTAELIKFYHDNYI